MNKDDLILVSVDAPFHRNRLGFLEIITGNTAVLRDQKKAENGYTVLFAVSIKHCKVVQPV